MRKMKLYIETSAWNFYYADDSPEFMKITKDFFELVFKGYYDVYISRIVEEEISRAPKEKQEQLFSLINKCNPKKLEVTEEVEKLSLSYITKQVIPEKKKEDALHVAVATIYEMDIVITWNFKHMAGVRRIELINAVNVEEGYINRLNLVTPMGVIEDGIS